MRCTVDVATQYEREQAAACGLCRGFHRIKGKRACLHGIPSDEMAKCIHFDKRKKPVGTKTDHRAIAESFFTAQPN